jgi:hypothetical protein
MEVDWQGVNSRVYRGFYSIDIRYPLSVLIYILPYPGDICIEDMRSVSMDHDIGLLISFSVTVTSNMLPLVDYMYLTTKTSQLTSYHRAGKPGPYD